MQRQTPPPKGNLSREIPPASDPQPTEVVGSLPMERPTLLETENLSDEAPLESDPQTLKAVVSLPTQVNLSGPYGLPPSMTAEEYCAR